MICIDAFFFFSFAIFFFFLNCFNLSKSIIPTYLVNDSVPRVSGIVYDDVYLAVSEFGCFLHELVDIIIIQHIPWYRNGAATALIDRLCHFFCLFYI